jgi:putative phage-type endonuclease
MKANVLARTLDLPREEWLRIRRQGIGGSDAGIVTGNSPWTTRLQLWKEKRGLLDELQQDNDAMKMGRILEPVVIDLFKERTGKSVHKVNAVLQSKEHPFLLGNLDGRIVGENAGFEAKTSASAEPWSDGGVPPAYLDQCQHLMALCGYDRFYLAVLVQGRTFHWMVVERNESHIRRLVEAEVAFWQLVELGIPPEPTPEEAVRQLEIDYPQPRLGLTVELERSAAERLLEVKRTLTDLEAEEERLRAELLEDMRDAEVGVFKGDSGSLKVIWRVTDGRAAFDSDRFRKEHGDLWQAYLKQTEPRRSPRFYVNAA